MAEEQAPDLAVVQEAGVAFDPTQQYLDVAPLRSCWRSRPIAS
jgi:hypothetical protein